jgi:RNA polymerase sigma-70 factor, ECF subfamily
MPLPPKPDRGPVNSSFSGGSERPPGADEEQLSAPGGVHNDVSSIAIDRGLLGMGSANADAPSRTASVAGLTDAEIMLRVKAGDESAFAYLVQKYRRPMMNFMFRMAHNAAAAEDLAQEVFLRVYRSRSGYEASAKFTTWLYRIATNLAVNYARDTQKVQALPERQRMAVIMHKYQQLDYRQIADVLKLSESATKSLLFRAYETLREQLKDFV